METLLICLLLLYNAWLVTYILLERRQKSSAETKEKPPTKLPETTDGIVGKSLFKMEVKTPQATITEPQAAKPDGYCYQHSQSHPPIQYKEIYQKSNGNQQV